ncbi:topoisomerase [Streptomyces klenkii]|uniref:toprim domain-containing protein n=1 Tax=Streptomyces klenkii TaxID=1420899 RepID=UPI0033FE10DE
MPTQYDSHKADLVAAAKKYYSHYVGSPAEPYIAHRGLATVADQFKLGFALEPITGHEPYRGRLAIPYLRPVGVATIRFRCIADTCVKGPDGAYLEPHEEVHEKHPKYLGLPGHPPMLYNTRALIHYSPHVALGEGEFDAMAAEVAGVPAAAIPGVSSWQDHFEPAFLGFETVFSLGDGDQAGRQFNEKNCERLPNVVPIDPGDGYDTNRFVKQFGNEAFRKKLGV